MEKNIKIQFENVASNYLLMHIAYLKNNAREF